MRTYIALLRGINVSGQKKIKMADLRTHLSSWGFSEVQTYIQSGNIVLQDEELAANQIAKRIHQGIQSAYGFDVPVMVLAPEYLDKVLANNPFLPEKDPKRLYVTFLSNPPVPELLDGLLQEDYSPEAFNLVEKHIYFFSPSGYGRAKMNNNFFEKKLKVEATTRNWRTVNKLRDMCAA
ncbi:MAG: DUF1697 domain-containing protein [Saprospiraceae bacterium]|nr:DUF1697 domain-containing protein [Saprospiraceae bacterium]